MPKRSSKKKPEDVNQLASRIVSEATETKITEAQAKKIMSALGRLGGLKGGKARAKKLSAARRKEIARKAAKSRWKSKSD